MSVVVPRVSTEDAGSYTCTAHNTEGTARSNCHPALRSTRAAVPPLQPRRWWASPPHAVNITCEVTAFPAAHRFTGRCGPRGACSPCRRPWCGRRARRPG
nr:MAM domain-containing glycosylphosphatidylinositol anchor protein 2-like [Penaeus vannamei]